MTERSIFWTTDGTGDGSSSGLTQDNMTEFLRALFTGRTANYGGVAPDYLNELAVSGTSSPVAVASGAAACYGFFYANTTAENVAIPTPASLTRIDRIVLRADWANQTVRITRIAGSEGGGAPSLTQNAGTTWDVPLAQASITTGGTITLTDQREWLGLLGDAAVAEVKLASGLLGPTVMYIPFLGNNSDAGGGGNEGAAFTTSSYVSAYPQVEINSNHFPSTSTVKLVAFGFSGAGATHNLQLYNVTDTAAVTGSELTVTSGAEQQAKSGDIRANLGSGAKRYAIQGKAASGTCLIHNAYILVEW